MKTTTYRCGLDRCESCGSRRDTRGIGEYLKHDNGQETLISCSDCHRQGEIQKVSQRIQEKLTAHIASREPKLLFPHVYRRVFRDVATRYILRFGGSTFKVQTNDHDFEVYLRNKFGFPIATVSMFDRFPTPAEAVMDMPF